MANVKRDPHMWTQKEIKLLAKLWTEKSLREIAEELNMRTIQVQSMARQIRLAGFKLPPKKIKGRYRSMIFECLKDSDVPYVES